MKRQEEIKELKKILKSHVIKYLEGRIDDLYTALNMLEESGKLKREDKHEICDEILDRQQEYYRITARYHYQ